MNRFGMFVFVQVALSSVAGVHALAGQGVSSSSGFSRFERGECPFDASGIDVETLECGYLSVPESRGSDDGRTLRLAVAVAEPRSATDDPVVLLPGGPGGGPLPGFISRVRAWIPSDRTLVVFDPRGTGYTGPVMCPELGATYGAIASLDVSLDESRMLRRGAELACRDGLLRQGIDLGAYNSTTVALDLRDLREALGYDRWNLMAGSYGVPFARAAIRVDPDGVRSAVLAIGPTQDLRHLQTRDVPFFARALDRVFDGCAARPSCREAFPDLREEFHQTYESLRERPLMVRVSPDEFRSSHFTVNTHDYVRAVYAQLWSESDVGHLPALIRAFGRRDTAVVRKAVEREFGGLGSDFSWGMMYSVDCYDAHTPRSWRDFVEAAVPFPAALAEIEFFLRPCSDWSDARASPEERAPLRSELPVLVLDGEFDPASPPVVGKESLRTLSRGHHVTIPGMGHMPGPRSERCWGSLIEQFFERPDQRPDTGCLEELPRVPILPELPSWTAQEFEGSSSPVEWRAVSSPDRASVAALVQLQDGTLVVGTRAGLFISRDLAGSWHPRGPGSRPVMSLLLTPEGALLAGTYRQGILRSTDRGESWTPVGFERNVYISGISRDSSGKIYAGVRGSVGDEPTGVFRSEDDGRTWTASGLSDEDVYSVSSPVPGVVYAGTEQGLFRSLNEGETWNRVGALPSRAPVSEVVVFDGDLFASMGAPLMRIPGGGVARSRDGGHTWELMDGVPAQSAIHSLTVSGGTLFAAAGDPAQDRGKGIYHLAADGRWEAGGLNDVWVQSLLGTPHGLFAGGIESGVFRSEDGRTWARRSAGLRNWEASSLAADGNGYVYAASQAELFRSNDGGSNWSALPLPEQATPPTPWSMSTGPAETLILGAKGGILVSESQGDAWEYREIPGEGGEVFALAMDRQGELYASVPGEAVYRSRTSGRSWSKLELPDVPVQAFLLGPNGTRFFTGAQGFWRWTEEEAWQLVGDEQVWELRSCGEHIVAATFARGLLRSIDMGRTWQPVTEPVRSRAQQEGYLTFTSLACLPDGGLLAGTFWDGVFHSSDGGVIWSNATMGLPVPTVMDFAVTPSGQIFASTPAGLYLALVNEGPDEPN